MLKNFILFSFGFFVIINMKNARYPMTNYENYELKCKIITENNNHYIQQFKEYLTLQGLSKKQSADIVIMSSSI